jgi:hypothetical protein
MTTQATSTIATPRTASRSTAITVAHGDGVDVFLLWMGGTPQSGAAISHRDTLALLEGVTAPGLAFIKTENLCTFYGVPGYSLGHGQ